MSANFLFNDAKFTTFRVPNAFGGAPTVYDGRRIPGSNPLTITGGINQVIPLANGARVIADVRSQYMAATYLWFTNLPSVYQDAYTRTDLSVTFEPVDSRFSVTGFVRNVEDRATLLQGGPTDPTTGAVFTNLNPPRTFGVIFGVKL